MKKNKRQQTKWIFRYLAGKNTGIKVGWIHNKNSGVPNDKIRLQIKSVHGFLDFNMRIDEGLAITCGITKVLAQKAIDKRIILMEENE